MGENKDAMSMDLLKNVPTETLIALLRTRGLTTQDVAALQSLRPAETTGSSQTTIATGDPKEIESSAEKFAKAVVRKNVHGKLPSGSKINNVRITSPGGFYNHGPDRVVLDLLEKGVSNLQETLYLNQYGSLKPDLVSSHVVSVTPSEAQPENMVLTIRFFQDRKQIDGRGYHTPAHVSTELSNDVMSEFLTEIQKNPDLLESFYQKTFVGLDSSGELPGMRRLKSNGFFLINGAKLEEAAKVRPRDVGGTRTFFSALEKYQYRNGPYGSGDAFQPG